MYDVNKEYISFWHQNLKCSCLLMITINFYISHDAKYFFESKKMIKFYPKNLSMHAIHNFCTVLCKCVLSRVRTHATFGGVFGRSASCVSTIRPNFLKKNWKKLTFEKKSMWVFDIEISNIVSFWWMRSIFIALKIPNPFLNQKNR